ncbi:MAG: Rab family GTPase [Promethearchaeota archaeon]
MQDALFKVCIFGDGGVGKTCLVNRYLTGLFKTDTSITIGVDFSLKRLDIEGKKIMLQIWDFAGEDRFRFLLPSYANGASGGIYMFDITRNTSLNNLSDWLEVFRKGANDNKNEIPIMMVGGKVDLNDRRSVFSIEAVNLAKNYSLFDYIECSAKTGQNIEIIFYKIARFLSEKAQII